MKKKATIITIFIAFMAITYTRTVFTESEAVRASSGVPDTAEAKKIQATIFKAYEIEANAARSFDTSQFASVFTNDSVAVLEPSTIEFIQEVAKDVAKTDGKLTHLLSRPADKLGYLDYKLAYYTWWRAGAEKGEALQAVAEKENRELTQEERQSLIDASGRVAPPRAQGMTSVPELKFESIEIKGDVALAVCDDGPRTIEMTLVKKAGQWYLAGGKLLRLHP